MMQFNFVENMIDKLSHHSLTMDDALKSETVVAAVKKQNKKVISFFVDNIGQLLCKSLEDQPSIESQRAMRIISSNSSKILCAICDGNEVLLIAKDIFNNNKMQKSTIINKFASVLDLCISMFPDSVNNFCFLTRMVRFCHHYEIFALLDSLVSSDQEEIKLFLETTKFKERLVSKLTKYHNGQSTKLTLEAVYSVYRVLISAVKNSQSNEEPSLIQFTTNYLNKCIGDFTLLENHWKLIVETLSPLNTNEFISIYGSALEAIEVIHEHNLIMKYQVHAIDFINAMIGYRPSFLTKIDGNILFSSLVKVFRNFPNSSIVLSSICELMVSAIETTELQRFVFDLFFPCLVELIESDEDNVNIRAFSTEFCRQVLILCLADAEVDSEFSKQTEFMECFLPRIVSNDVILSKEYGGLSAIQNFVQCTSLDSLKTFPGNFNLSV